MIKDIFSLHTYMIINCAILVSYVLSRALFTIPWLAQSIQQIHKLKFARYCLLSTISIFLLMPFLMNIKPIANTNIEFKPIFQHASYLINESQKVVTSQINVIEKMPASLSIKSIIIVFLMLGFLFHLTNYIKTILILNRIKIEAFRLHKIGNTHILFTNTYNIPFCWSLVKKHYIALPTHLAEIAIDRKLSIQHELQHIRQGDTHWLHCMQILKLFCFWNPFLILWINWSNDLQEYACDEQIVLRKKISPSIYAQCIVDRARHSFNSGLLVNRVTAINGFSKSTLYRRVNMIFTYKRNKRKLALIMTYAISICAISTTAVALNGTANSSPLPSTKISYMIKKSDHENAFHITATPEVVAEINKIRSDDHARAKMLSALKRMHQYKSYLKDEFHKNNMPSGLLALPLIESGYQPLNESVNPMRAAGIWQIIPSTGEKMGLVINDTRDDRMNMELATHAAIKYLNQCYDQFHDWKLAVIAYEIGENQTQKLIDATGSRDAWTLVNAMPEQYKNDLKKYITMFDATVIIINHPEIISA